MLTLVLLSPEAQVRGHLVLLVCSPTPKPYGRRCFRFPLPYLSSPLGQLLNTGREATVFNSEGPVALRVLTCSAECELTGCVYTRGGGRGGGGAGDVMEHVALILLW